MSPSPCSTAAHGAMAAAVVFNSAAFSTFSAVAVLQQSPVPPSTAAAAHGAVCTYYSCWPSKLLRKKYDEATADLQPTSARRAAAGSGGTTTERRPLSPTLCPVCNLASSSH